MIQNKFTKKQKIILIVEDEPSLRALMEEALSAAGYKVVMAGDGVDGLKKLQAYEPDLIICDRAMPAMTGYELLERIRGVYPQYRAVPFIFLTALTDQRDKQIVQGLQPTAYLEKPLDFDVLLHTIEQSLSN